MPTPELSPTALVATLEAIRAGHFRPEHRQPLTDAGFDWDAFTRHLDAVQAARVGYSKGTAPVRVQLDDPDKRAQVEAILPALRDDLTRLRELGPRVFTGVEQIHSRVQCSVPDGTEHFELRPPDPASVFVITLQDASQFIRDELPLLARMTHAWAIHLFGNYLHDDDFEQLDFRRHQELRLLDLAENHLTRLPPGLTHCAKLERLSLARNAGFAQLPDDLGRLSRLRLLDLRGVRASAALYRKASAALPGCELRI